MFCKLVKLDDIFLLKSRNLKSWDHISIIYQQFMILIYTSSTLSHEILVFHYLDLLLMSQKWHIKKILWCMIKYKSFFSYYYIFLDLYISSGLRRQSTTFFMSKDSFPGKIIKEQFFPNLKKWTGHALKKYSFGLRLAFYLFSLDTWIDKKVLLIASLLFFVHPLKQAKPSKMKTTCDWETNEARKTNCRSTMNKTYIIERQMLIEEDAYMTKNCSVLLYWVVDLQPLQLRQAVSFTRECGILSPSQVIFVRVFFS